MSHNKSATGTCQVCGQTFPVRELVAAPIVRDNIAAEIRREHPEWNESASICRTDLARYRAQYVHALLLSEKGELSTLENDSDRQKLMVLLRTFFEVHKGWHIQYNIVSRETLLAAKAHPDQYRDLVVRVAGYSAFFTALSPDAQDDIIARTEHSL